MSGWKCFKPWRELSSEEQSAIRYNFPHLKDPESYWWRWDGRKLGWDKTKYKE